jgi:tetratricopeptide (TPR) repeat protein
MAPLHDRMEAGLAMAAEGRYEEMEKAFRRILAEQPFYGRRAEMVPGYVAYGDELVESRDLDRAALMFKVAERLDVDGKHADAIAARLLLTEGLRSIEEGAPDAQPLRMALERDPDLELAGETLEQVERLDAKRRIGRYRIMGALGIGSAAIIVLVLLVIRRLGDS